MTRTGDTLRVGASTDVVKLKSAVTGRLVESGGCKLEAIGMRAIGTALKAIAIIGTPNQARQPFNIKTSVNSRKTTIESDGRTVNLTVRHNGTVLNVTNGKYLRLCHLKLRQKILLLKLQDSQNLSRSE